MSQVGYFVTMQQIVNFKLPNWDREGISNKVNGWIKTNLTILLPCPNVVQIVLFVLVDMDIINIQ